MRKSMIALAALLPLAAGGCISTAAHIVTAPVRITSKAVDWTTTSQSESDRNYGRKMRKQEAREGRERKKAAQACKRNGGQNCAQYDGYRAGQN